MHYAYDPHTNCPACDARAMRNLKRCPECNELLAGEPATPLPERKTALQRALEESEEQSPWL